MSKKICKECASFDGTCCQSGFAFPYEIECSDDHCEYFAEKPKPNLFDRITTSPEVLAEKLVYRTIEIAVNRVTYSCWKSTITEEAYRTKAEALAATVAKLKEVCDD